MKIFATKFLKTPSIEKGVIAALNAETNQT